MFPATQNNAELKTKEQDFFTDFMWKNYLQERQNKTINAKMNAQEYYLPVTTLMARTSKNMDILNLCDP